MDVELICWRTLDVPTNLLVTVLVLAQTQVILIDKSDMLSLLIHLLECIASLTTVKLQVILSLKEGIFSSLLPHLKPTIWYWLKFSMTSYNCKIWAHEFRSTCIRCIRWKLNNLSCFWATFCVSAVKGTFKSNYRLVDWTSSNFKYFILYYFSLLCLPNMFRCLKLLLLLLFFYVI